MYNSEDHIERVKQEHEDLTNQTKALNILIHSDEIFKKLSDLEQEKMIKQVGFMESYAQTLESIILFSKEIS